MDDTQAPPTADPNNPLRARLNQIKADQASEEPQVVGGISSVTEFSDHFAPPKADIEPGTGRFADESVVDEPNFFQSLTQVPLFPVKGPGLLWVGMWIGLCVMLVKVVPHMVILIGMAGLHLFGLMVLATLGYFMAWLTGIGIATTRGAELVRGLPKLDDFNDDVLRPAGLYFATLCIGMLPYAAYNWNHSALQMLEGIGFWGMITKLFALFFGAIRENPVDWVLIGIGVAYQVTALPLVFATGFSGLSPAKVATAFGRLFVPLIVATGLIFGIYTALGFIGGKINPESWGGVAIIIGLAVVCQVMVFRILGLVHRCHASRLRDIAPLNVV